MMSNPNYKGKASGDLNFEGGLVNVDEIGKEIIIPPSGRMDTFEYGTSIIPHNISENLMKWGTMNPYAINRMPSIESTINNDNRQLRVNIDTIKLDNVTNGENFLPELNNFLRNTQSVTLR